MKFLIFQFVHFAVHPFPVHLGKKSGSVFSPSCNQIVAKCSKVSPSSSLLQAGQIQLSEALLVHHVPEPQPAWWSHVTLIRGHWQASLPQKHIVSTRSTGCPPGPPGIFLQSSFLDSLTQLVMGLFHSRCRTLQLLLLYFLMFLSACVSSLSQSLWIPALSFSVLLVIPIWCHLQSCW